MMEWIKENLDIKTLLEIAGIIIFAIGFVFVFVHKVDSVEATQDRHIDEYQEFRYQKVPSTYMRKDVMEQVLIRLERIEQKLDQRNGE